MAYLGQTAHETEFTNRVTDTMTGDGSDTTLTLSSAPISVNNVIVFIDGVMQRPTTDYTVSGTTLTFAVAPHNSANVQAIIGGGEHIGVPLAPITEDQLVDGVVTSAKLESGIQIPASKITSLAASKITGALPALDGSSLTSMPPTGVGIDNVTTNPSPTTNPSGGVGTIHLNKTTGEMFVCTNATANNNIWFNVGEGSGDISNAVPTNPTSTNSFPDLTLSTSTAFTFSGATDSDGSVTHYMVDQISNAALTVSAAEVAAGSAHTFITGNVGSDTAVTFRVRSKDNIGAYSSGVTVSMTILAVSYTSATGGSMSTSGDYIYHHFTGNGTFTVSSVGTPGNNVIDLLVVAGGGGGGGGTTYIAMGGGGAGGMLEYTNMTVTAGSYGVTVGAGGPHKNTGSNSSINIGGSNRLSYGGGYGSDPTASKSWSHSGGNGGSGGGSGYSTPPGVVGTGTSGQGNNGGPGHYWGDSNYAGGGGGGKNAAGGATAGLNSNGGAGGAGYFWVNGVYYSGGGGGGSGHRYSMKQGGAGGNGGGGAGGGNNTGNNQGNGVAGTANKGGGGGGCGGDAGTASSSIGGNGGSGIVVMRYKYQN